jgi:hypothetical protein
MLSSIAIAVVLHIEPTLEYGMNLSKYQRCWLCIAGFAERDRI